MSTQAELYGRVLTKRLAAAAEKDGRAVQWRSTLDRIAERRANRLGISKERQDRAFWEKILDVLNTGNYAAAGTALALKRGDPEVWGAVVRGIRDRTTYSDVLKEFGVTGGTGVALGLVGDIFLDPLTYVPGFGMTTKGKVVTDLLRHMSDAGVVAPAAQRAFIAKYVNEMANPRLQGIARKAVEEGEKTLFARTFPERVQAGLQRAFVIERPSGLLRVPVRVRGTKLRLPTPIPKFESTGIALPFPKPVEVAFAGGVRSLGVLASKAPGISRIKKFMGDKFFGSMVRPEGANPILWNMLLDLNRQMQRAIPGRTTALHKALEDLGTTERPSAELWKRVGVEPGGQAWELMEHVFREGFRKRYGAEHRRALLLMIEEPERALHPKTVNVAEEIIKDVLVREPSDKFFRAVVSGRPADVSELLDSSTSVKSLDDIENKLERGIIYHARELDPYENGVRATGEADYHLIQEQMQNMEAALEQVRARRLQIAPPRPIKPRFSESIAEFPGPRAPSVDPSVMTRFHGPAGDAMALRDSLYGQLDQYKAAIGNIATFAQQSSTSAGLVDNAMRAMQQTFQRANKTANQIEAIDADLLSSVRRAEEAKRLGEERGTQILREVQAIRKTPAMRGKAAEVLPEARRELEDMERQIARAEELGDQETAARILDEFTARQGETLASRFERVTAEQGLGPLEQRALVKEMAQGGQASQYRLFQESQAPESLYMAAAGAPEHLRTAQNAARILDTDMRGLQRVAAVTSPIRFQQRVLAGIESLSPQEVNQIGEDLVGSVAEADLGEVHRLLRESQGLPPSSLGLQLADLGMTEPEAMAQLASKTETAFERLRGLDPTSPISVDSVHVVGPYARGEGQVGEPMEAIAFVRSELDESTLALAMNQKVDLNGALIPTEVRITPWRLTPDQTKEEVLRAFGATPLSGRATEPELFPTAPEVRAVPITQTPDEAVAKSLTAAAPNLPKAALLQLTGLRRKIDATTNQARVMRTRKPSLAGFSRAVHDRMSRDMGRIRHELDTWEKAFYGQANALERASYEGMRRDLNKYDPERLTAEGLSARQAMERNRPRKYRVYRMAQAAPLTTSGQAAVNPKSWPPGALEFFSINRENALDTIRRNRSLLGPGSWVEYEPNGAATGKTLGDDEFLDRYGKLSKGQARTLAATPEGIELDRAWHRVLFDPETHTLEIADDAGMIYQRQLDIPLNPEAFPTSVRLATHKIRATYGADDVQTYKNFEEFQQDFLQRYADDPAVKARLSGLAGVAPETQKSIQDLLDAIGFETIGVKGEAKPKPAKIKAFMLGLGPGPGGFIPRVVGQYKPWGHFRVGEFVSLEGVPGQVVASPADNVRRVQLQTGQVIDVPAVDLKLATLREIARNDHSVVDFLQRAAMRADGSIDKAELRRMVQGLERDRLLGSVMAENLTEDLVRGLPITRDLLLAKGGLKSLLEGMWADERSLGILTGRINFYVPRRRTDELKNTRTAKFGSMPKIQMEDPWFTKHRGTAAYTIEQMREALKAQGQDPRWADDVLSLIGTRGVASIKYTEATRFLTRLMSRVAKRIDSKGIDAAMDGYESILRDVYHLPEERISRVTELVEELIEMEGRSKTGALRTGVGARGFLEPEEQTARLQRIEQIRTELNELAPPIAFVIPKGALARYQGELESKTSDLLAQDAVISADQVRALSVLTQDANWYEGSQFLEVPIDKLWAVRMMPKEVPAFMMPKEIADAVNGHLSNYADIGEDLNQFLRIFDMTQNYWKAWTLGVFPAYHVRNFVGNVWNAFLAGAYDPERWEEGGRFFSRNLDGFKTKYGKQYTQEELENIAFEGNLLRRGEYTVETRLTPSGEVRETSLIPIPLKGLLDQYRGKVPKQHIALAIGTRIGSRNEDWAKVAVLLDGLYKGMSPSTAVERAHKYLFDYDSLGTVEKAIMPRLFPFYRWSRFNIPLQLEALATRPAKFTGAYDAIQAIREHVGEPPEERFLPEWMKDQTPVPVKKFGPGKYGYFLLGNWLPAADLVRASDPSALAGGMLTPLIKAPFEYAANWSLFTRQDVERFPKEVGDFLGLKLRQRDINLLRNVRLLNEADKLAFKKELPFPTRAVRTITGRIYPVDYVDQAQFRAYALSREESAIKTSIIRAQKQLLEERSEGNRVRVSQLKSHIRVLQSDLREVVKEQERLRVSLPKKTKGERRIEQRERRLVEIGAGL